jgi:hypothetical protein
MNASDFNIICSVFCLTSYLIRSNLMHNMLLQVHLIFKTQYLQHVSTLHESPSGRIYINKKCTQDDVKSRFTSLIT